MVEVTSVTLVFVIAFGVIVLVGITVTFRWTVNLTDRVVVDEGTGLMDLVPYFVMHTLFEEVDA
jgi:hypothetical protein